MCTVIRYRSPLVTWLRSYSPFWASQFSWTGLYPFIYPWLMSEIIMMLVAYGHRYLSPSARIWFGNWSNSRARPQILFTSSINHPILVILVSNFDPYPFMKWFCLKTVACPKFRVFFQSMPVNWRSYGYPLKWNRTIQADYGPKKTCENNQERSSFQSFRHLKSNMQRQRPAFSASRRSIFASRALFFISISGVWPKMVEMSDSSRTDIKNRQT